ncbi:MAG TPA: hypothetical protein VM056_05405 [Terriglobales bacterium]|nr:hypothetical protein [Terriglobales bacterium]
MIILVSTSMNAKECAAAMEKQTGERVVVSSTLRECTDRLHGQDFSAVVVDQVLLDSSPAALDMLWKHAQAAILVTVNFAISGAGRVVGEVRAALLRRERERTRASKAAEANLRNELTGAVTGILLSSELALAQPELPVNVVSKLRSVHELAMQMKSRLGPAA